MKKKRYKAVIKNIDKNSFLKTEANLVVSHTKDIKEALVFYDENEAETLIDILNECKQYCYQLQVF